MSMRFNQVVEQYTSFLLKLCYLNVHNRQMAEDIVQEVLIALYEKYGDNIPLENTKSYLVTMTMNRCRGYFKSWNYRKIRLLKVFSKETNYEISHVGQRELVLSISKLPINFREVIMLYYFDEQTTTEIAKTLSCPISTVRARLQRAQKLLNTEKFHAKIIDAALGNWDTESTRVKQEIFRVSIEKQASKAKHKRLKLWRVATIATLLVLMLGGFLLWPKEEEAKEPVSLIETPAPEFVLERSEILPHDKTIQLYKYEAFYLSGGFGSEIQAEMQALSRVMSIYPTLYHMNKHNYFFPEDREEHYRNRAAAMFQLRMKEPDFNKYFDFIQRKYGITEEDYIEHYYFLEEKYNYMQNILHTKYVGYVEGGYPSGEVEKEYEAVIGITLDELEEKHKEESKTIENTIVNLKDEVKNPPLEKNMTNFKFVYNEEGEVIILPREYNLEYYEYYYGDVYGWAGWATDNVLSVMFDHLFTYESGPHKQLPSMNRVNLPEYVKLLEQFEGTAEQESLAQEIIAFIRILENSIDMEVENQSFGFILPQ